MHSNRLARLDETVESQAHLLTPPAPGPAPDAPPTGGQMASVAAENLELRAEVDRLRSERGQLREVQRQIMELLATRTPEKILHDLRNVLNERDLLKTLVAEL